jgi:glyoxylase-like metal-dependent hydrolase (beta-lactamase superfamily II)
MPSRSTTFGGGALIAALAIAQAALLHQPIGSLHAQQHPSTTIAGLETLRIRPNVSVIFGAGANVTVHNGEDGLVLVDSGSTDIAGTLLEAVRAISPRPIRLIVNTSADADHVGGNGTLAAGGTPLSPDPFSRERRATVLAHENVLLRMSAPTGQQSPFPAVMWPTETFTSRYRSMYVNDEAVQVIRQTGARTDGDVMVLFRKSDVVVSGDIIDLRHFPVIDRARGGSIQRELEALNRLLTEFVVQNIPQVLKASGTLVVPGHGYVCDYGEVVEYRDMLTVIADIIESMVGKNMSLEQVKAANPTRGYRARYGAETGSWTTDMFVEAVYDSVKEARP